MALIQRRLRREGGGFEHFGLEAHQARTAARKASLVSARSCS
jgi:hypothetical protein